MTQGKYDFPTIYQAQIHASKYARWREEDSRRETWEETVGRYISFMEGHIWEECGYDFKDVSGGLKEAILTLEVMPSMRALMTAGPALKRDNVAGFNCSALAVNRPQAFDEALYLLCCGVGVGFSVERQFINQLPEVPWQLYPSDTTIAVRDSKIGWASALRQLIHLLYSGIVPRWDTSKVRPAGARLKTFGGRSSGPGPLVDLFQYVVATFKAAQGRKLSSIEAHGIMCKIGDIVVVGGVRRSALISLSNPSDDRMRDAKQGQWSDQHPEYALANNSAAWTEKPSMERFMDEWTALIKSKSGERGIFNREGARKKVAALGRREDHEFLLNPCAEVLLRDAGLCVAGNTPIITYDGIVDIADLQDESTKIWNGERWSDVTIRKTRSNQTLLRVFLSDGSYLDCTPDHKFSVKDRFKKEWCEVEARHLMSFSKYPLQVQPTVINYDGGRHIASAYTLGFGVGDGSIDRGLVYIDLYGAKDGECPVEGRRAKEYLAPGYQVPRVRTWTSLEADLVTELKTDVEALREVSTWDKESILQFVAGLADADGSETGTGGIRIYISQESRARTLQLILTQCGIRSSVCLLHRAGTRTNKGIRKHDLWYLQITDCARIPCHRLDVSKGHRPRFKSKYQSVVRVEKLEGLHDTFCFNEPERHMGVFGNVLTYQCNLSEVVVRPDDSWEDLERKVRLSAILGTFQSTLTNFRYLSGRWKKNADEERLLGVSLTGIMDNALLSDPDAKGLASRLSHLRQVVIDTNAEWAEKLGINQSVATTVIKPSGTVSQLVDAASGIHPRWSKYYVRTNRGNKTDPVAQMLYMSGVPTEDEAFHPDTTWVFSYPQKAPEHSVVRDELSAVDQLKIWLVYAEHWCEHNPSCTVYVREHEWLEVGAFVYRHFDRMCGVSFLPHSDHTYKQAPYQEVDRSTYERLAEEMPKELDWSLLAEYEKEDTTEGIKELACVAGACEVV